MGGFFIGLGCLAYFTQEEDLPSGGSSPSPSGAPTPSMNPPPESLNFASMMQLMQAQNQMNQQAFETKLTAALARSEAKNVLGAAVGSNSEEIKRMMKRLDDFEYVVGARGRKHAAEGGAGDECTSPASTLECGRGA